MLHGWRVQEIEKLTGTEADDGEEDISMMVLPDYSSGNNEKDIHVRNFNINVGGLELLDSADLKLAYGRKVRCSAATLSVLSGTAPTRSRGGGSGAMSPGGRAEDVSRFVPRVWYWIMDSSLQRCHVSPAVVWTCPRTRSGTES